jgi:serine-type D-Ala-D-Ala carboxypeptidase (penicillin-binding protein 5/6)
VRRPAAICGAALGALAFALPAGAASFPTNVHAFLVEGPQGEVLAQRNANRQVPIASLTKLMTVYIALRHLGVSSDVTVPEVVTTVGESSADLTAGQVITVRDLLGAALVPSANDAADTLAYAASNGESFTEFAGDMDAQARKLGLRHTRFDRPDGLSDGDESSAHDITELARLLMRRQVIRQTVRLRAVTIDGRVLPSRNNLLSTFPGVIGVKTGHTDAAGWCEVIAARRNGVTVYVTVLGAPSESERDADLEQLLDWGLSRYRRAVVADPHTVYAQAATQFGRSPVDLVVPHRIVRPVRTGRPLVARVVSYGRTPLPVAAGEILGEMQVSQSGRVVARSKLVARESRSKPGMLGRAGWYLGEAAHKVWSFL